MIGLIGKYPIWIVSRRDSCEERHLDHPGGTTVADVGGVAREAARDGSRGFTVHITGAPHSTRHFLHHLRKGPQNMENLKIRSKKSNSKVSMSLPFFVGNKYIIGTARSLGHF